MLQAILELECFSEQLQEVAMTDEQWYKELTPGTLIIDKSQRQWHLVIRLEIQRMPIGWCQLYVTTLSPNSLQRVSIESTTFHARWYKVRE